MIVLTLFSSLACVMASPTDEQLKWNEGGYTFHTLALYVNYLAMYYFIIAVSVKPDGIFNVGFCAFSGLVLFFAAAKEKKSIPAYLSLFQMIIAIITMIVIS